PGTHRCTRKHRDSRGSSGNWRELLCVASLTPARDLRVLNDRHRDPAYGSRGRRFKSCHPDRKVQVRACFSPGLRRFCCPFRTGLWRHPTAGTDAFRDASVSAVVTSRDLAGTYSPFWVAIGGLSSSRCRRSTGRGGAFALGVFVSVEERVGACGGVGEVPGVGVEVAAGGLDRFVAEDALEDVERDACVGEPGRSGVTQSVPGEAG